MIDEIGLRIEGLQDHGFKAFSFLFLPGLGLRVAV